MPDVKLPVEEEIAAESEPQEVKVEGGTEEDARPDVPSEISILPLRDSVIYPMLIAPLSVAREASVQLIDESVVGNNRVVGVVAQREPQIEAPGFDDVFEYGCAVIIRTLVKMPDAVRLIVQGVSRFRIVEKLQVTPYLRARIEAAVTPRTKAILPVDVFGQIADFDSLRDIAKRRRLALIEDSCEALGSTFRGRRAGSFGDAGVFGLVPGASDLVPEVNREEGHWIALTVFAGVVLYWLTERALEALGV